MSELNRLLRRRLGFPQDAKLTFEDLDAVLGGMAVAIPFENLRVVARRPSAITRAYVTDKILARGEGGLCYELNALLYLFLIDNGFEAITARGIVYFHDTSSYSAIGRTHMTVLLKHEGRSYLVDSGFGGNLALKPVPLSGETVESRNGAFRIEPASGERAVHGDYTYWMKLAHKDNDWRVGYTFDSRIPAAVFADHEEVRELVFHHPASTFNKRPLVTRLTEDGSATLTDTSFTQWRGGVMTKEEFAGEGRFEELLSRHFGMRPVSKNDGGSADVE